MLRIPDRRWGMIAAALLLGCASPGGPASPAPSPQAKAELAPSGRLRAAINFGNPVLASRDSAAGAPRGVSVDIAHELARRLDVPVELVPYTAAGKVVDDARANAWDIAFVAIDPKRAADMDYSAPYVIIEGAYLVRDGSPIHSNAAVDREGIRVVVGTGSAYDLYLSRELKHATLVRTSVSQEVTNQMLAQNLEVAAGVKQQLQADARRVPTVRLLDGRFMVIEQAMATPKGRPDGARYLVAFVEDLKATGFIADSLRRNAIDGAAVAPAASP